jgi:agmatine deiminase
VSVTLRGTPAADGFRMPAEWEPHVGCWMAWPERTDTWRNDAEPAQRTFASVAAAIARTEPVTMTASPAQLERARAMVPPEVRVVELSTDDAWMRDIGPTFVVDDDGGRRGVDWVFNAWGGLDGGLYAPWDRDDAAASRICEIEEVDRYRAPMVLEGGSIHVDGEGTLLTTEECLLNPNRNPGLTREEIERHLCDHTGASTVVWLGAGVYDDETDGHVDNLCCFVRPGVVALTWTDDRDDPQHEISVDARRRLDAAGFEVHLVHQPGPLHMTDDEAAGLVSRPGSKPRPAGSRLAASYVNFYLADDQVIVPLLDPVHDDAALQAVQGMFTDRRVVGVEAREILLGGGNIHCITQQVPFSGPREPARARSCSSSTDP